METNATADAYAEKTLTDEEIEKTIEEIRKMRAHQDHLQRNAEERALSAEIRAERDALEIELAKLRDSKASKAEDTYYREIEALLLKIAKLYERAAAKAD